MDSQTRENIKKVAEKIDVPEWKIKETLGLPLSGSYARTLKEFDNDYRAAAQDSEAQRAIFIDYENFILRELKKISDIDIKGALKLYGYSFFSNRMEQVVFAKCDEISLRLAKKAKTESELIEVLSLVSKNGQGQRTAIKKLYKLILKKGK